MGMKRTMTESRLNNENDANSVMAEIAAAANPTSLVL